ncbi:response regulator [Bacillus horti]|uniref:Two-component system response regulator YesN n=1 Tax=Caldalkalibacillus horti TaxID=77523 RepID=A0ABT9W3Q3_9BACI|nr:response regulator [Bacillus horti]MDQ0167475.1 two-component system response regulator YesN [Bacillus horti]
MIKLLIVDDEQVERQGMQAILERSFPHLRIQQAKNGKMAIELATEFTPDLILMDIKMPGMTGLEAVEKISSDFPAIKFIMVTAYDTFQYMKAAIKLGVKDYILKPSKASEIVSTIGKVIEQIITERDHYRKSQLQQEVWEKAQVLVETDVVTQFLFDHVHEVHVDMLINMLEIPSSDELFVMVLHLPEGAEVYYSLIKEKVRQKKSGWVGALYGRQLPIIVFRQYEFSYRSQASAWARDFLSLPATTESTDWFIGIGGVYKSLDDIRTSYQEALMTTIDMNARKDYHFYEDISFQPDRLEENIANHKELVDNIRLGKWDRVYTQVMNQLTYFEKGRTAIVHAQQRILELLWIASRMMSESGIETVTPLYMVQPLDYRQLRGETDQLIQKMKQSYEQHITLLESDTFHKLKQYIIDHSQEDISLDTLAQKVQLSPIYISKMFKEKQGVNYIEFLTECRMEKAKSLLADAEKSIKEITFEVGYHDPNYFSKVFKKVTYISPKEYRKTMLGQQV